MIDRRALISGLLSIGAPTAAHAQTRRMIGKIGYLNPASVGVGAISLATMIPIWERLGYVLGKTILLRSAERDPRRLPELVAELINLEVGVLVVFGAVAVRAASQTATSTPIVAVDFETDPVRSGLAVSLAQPGGNVTGLFLDQSSLAEKWLQLLREATPQIERVAIVWDPKSGPDQLDASMAAARSMGMQALVLEMQTSEEFETFRNLDNGPRTGIVVLASPFLNYFPARLAQFSLKYRLPTISFYKPHANAGTLMSYGPNLEVYFPRGAILADQILKGAKPSDLPIERPTKFELVINLKTAKELSISVAPALLSLADEVIE